MAIVKGRAKARKHRQRAQQNKLVLAGDKRERGMAALKPQLGGLARLLVSYGLLDESTAKQAVDGAKRDHTPFISYLVKQKTLSSRVIATAVLKDFGFPLFDLDSYDRTCLPAKVVSEKLIRRHHALPLLKRGNQLFLAISDPTNQSALDEIKFNTGLNTHCILVEEDKLSINIEKALAAQDSHSALGDLSDADLEKLNISSGEAEPDETEEVESKTDDAPIVRFVNKVLLDAINQGASDIHFEPYENSYRVRFRQDGILTNVASPPHALGNRIASRLKVMSQLDISERRIPQDGRFKMTLSRNRSIDFRVSTCPTVGGEKVVMRILDPTAATLGIEALGYFDNQKQAFLNAIHKPQGMVLVTGPTGSGKTVSLYTALNILNTAERNISTAEDPVELNVNGINQVPINTKTGLTFASALKSFLRQDPDIIMVGEIRDLETAEIAIKAAQTGHLVLSTLHTNSAPETLTRMVNMGVPSFNIATSTTLVIAQRLARRLCKHCKQPATVPSEVLVEAGFSRDEIDQGVQLFDAVGCDHCNGGYKGRVGIYEVLSITPQISEVIMAGGNSLDILKVAKEQGMKTLYESGLMRAKEGITTLKEINRVTKE